MQIQGVPSSEPQPVSQITASVAQAFEGGVGEYLKQHVGPSGRRERSTCALFVLLQGGGGVSPPTSQERRPIPSYRKSRRGTPGVTQTLMAHRAA
jgi:hypothetical protein